MCITETWLDDTYPSAILSLNDYVIYRRDRGKRGGGLLIAIKNTFVIREVTQSTCTELIAVDIMNPNFTLRVIVGYIPKIADTIYLDKFLSEMTDFAHKSKNFVIFGDFNIPEFNWDSYTYPIKKSYNMFKNFIDKLSPVSQLINFPTRHDHILDVILTNRPDLFSQIRPDPPLGNSDHVVVVGTMSLKIKQDSVVIIRKDFVNANYSQIIDYLNKNFQNFFINKEPQFLWNKFYSIVNACISNFVQNKKIYIHKNRLVTFKTHCLYIKLKRFYRKWKISGDMAYLRAYKLTKSKLRQNVKQTRCKYESRLVSSQNRLKFFRYVNSMLNHKTNENLSIKDKWKCYDRSVKCR